ncbi:MAG: hypothetical protein LBS74_10245 [Oscillospiraceae bacterium]|jgi:thiol:disulfide interchange protein|nr:hypothetical protein [Oscillospiraceae bacterium]
MIVSFQKLRTFLAALISALVLGGFVYLVTSNLIPTTGDWLTLIHLGLGALFGALLFVITLFKKNRTAFRFDLWAFIFLLLPALYLVLFPQIIDWKIGIYEFLPALKPLQDLFNVLFGYALLYTFFENTTVEYEKGKAQARSANRKVNHEKRKNKKIKKAAQ